MSGLRWFVAVLSSCLFFSAVSSRFHTLSHQKTPSIELPGELNEHHPNTNVLNPESITDSSIPSIPHGANAEFMCGETPVVPRNRFKPVGIVGGEEAVPYSWPWQAEMCVRMGGRCRFNCAGSLVADQWIMTAAHCVERISKHPELVGIKLGTFDFSSTKEKGTLFLNVSEIHPHPQFRKPHHYSFDVALLKLSRPVYFDQHIQPVCITDTVEDLVKEGKKAYVTGWGAMSENGNISPTLRQVMVPFLDMKHCEMEYPGQIDNTMECAGKEGFDACQGDSGGPLVTQHEDGRWFQAGIVSWGEGCAEREHAGVYSRPSAFCNFLEKQTGQKICRH